MKTNLPLDLYYAVKPLLPRRVQVAARRAAVRRALERHRDVWPIRPDAAAPPPGWAGWPAGRDFALVLTHDVDTRRGQPRCLQLMAEEAARGFRSAFFFVAGISSGCGPVFDALRERGFEVGVHGLFHDRRTFRSRPFFERRAALINRFAARWGALGHRSPSMYHDLDWLLDLDVLYDASTFDVDPFEPQPDGAGTIFPFLVESAPAGRRYVELPYTLPQDYTLFILLRETSPAIWERKLAWLAEKGGMALVITHPDYMHFGKGGRRPAVDEYPARRYLDFLDHVRERYEGRFWQALPREVAAYRLNGSAGGPAARAGAAGGPRP